ncbi:MAG: RsmB/NOP family class I SAM-dependent RNA methyltransferase [Opitutaceae bacterium]|nr:RsmB/NOP family class I SAM-dependent RNA methyltransferase [Opitutaceae bacterium]
MTDHPARVDSRARVFAGILAELRRHWAADRALPDRLRRLLADRRFGSRDRRQYREWAYVALRHGLWLGPLFDQDPVAALAALRQLAGEKGEPDALPVPAQAVMHFLHNPPAPDAPPSRRVLDALLPAWFQVESPGACRSRELAVLHERAPVWVRARRSLEVVKDALASEGISATAGQVVPGSLRVALEQDVAGTRALAEGLFEIQDAGSQRILFDAVPFAGRWLDACAGAGGKTLQLADLLGDAGTVEAWEPRSSARSELQLRLARARLNHVRVLGSRPEGLGGYDGVLVDAPCSGSGTWRRSPHLKLCTTEADVRGAAATQFEILSEYATHVRKGGRLLYATCSLCQGENEEVVSRFLGVHPDFHLERQRTYWPSEHDGDGFFAAHLKRA